MKTTKTQRNKSASSPMAAYDTLPSLLALAARMNTLHEEFDSIIETIKEEHLDGVAENRFAQAMHRAGDELWDVIRTYASPRRRR